MALIQFDNANSATGSGTSLSFSANAGSNSDRGLIAGVTSVGASGDKTTGVTFNSVAMTKIGSVQINGGGDVWFSLWHLENPASGSHTLTVTGSAAAASLGCAYSAYYNFFATLQPDASGTAQAASPAASISKSLTTLADNCWTVFFGGNNSSAIAAGTNSTLRKDIGGGLGGIVDSNGPKTPAGSTSLQITGSAGDWGGIIASFIPSTEVSRYWVGGTGTWDAATTTHWSFSSGGPGGAPVPDSTNNVYFDANSGGGTVTLSTSPSVIQIDFTGYTGTISLGSNTVTLSGTGSAWNMAAGASVTAGTSTINYTNSSSSSKTFVGAGKTYYNLTFTSGSSGTYTISGANTFHNFYHTGSGTGALTVSSSNTFADFKVDTPPHTVNFGAGTTQTVTTFTVSGTAGNLMTLQSTSAGTAWFLSKAGGGTVSCDYLSLQDSHAF